MSVTRNPGRVAGLWYLSLVLLGPLRLIYIPSKLFVTGNAAATVSNIAAHEMLFRLGIAFYDTVPQFGNPASMLAFERALVEDEITLAYIDPCYLAMETAGNEASLFAMGSLLRNVSELCQRIGCTPVLLHHMKKSVADPYSPGDLDDASWAGFAEFCRGWMLINRRERYNPGSGIHRLWLSVGGSAGHGGLWGVDINEGVYQGPDSRVWDVQVRSVEEVRSEVQANTMNREQEKADRKAKLAEQADAKRLSKLMDAMVSLGESTQRDIKSRSGMNGEVFARIWAMGLDGGHIANGEPIIKGKGQRYETFKLVTGDSGDSLGTHRGQA